MLAAHSAFGGGTAKAHDEAAFQKASAPGRGGAAGDFVQLPGGEWVPAGMAGGASTGTSAGVGAGAGTDPAMAGLSLALSGPSDPGVGWAGDRGARGMGGGLGQRTPPMSMSALASVMRQHGRVY